jgi:Uma2 family endonuclease
MNTIVVDEESIHIPEGVHRSLASFRQWAHSDTFPQTGRICYLNGEVWVDMSKEQFFSHNQIKTEYAVVLGGLAKANRLGRYVSDGMLISHVVANFSTQPDGAFLSYESLQSDKIRLVEGVREGNVELEGTPDMALEVVSAGSVVKDTETLRELYWQAGITEYWLVDCRGDRVIFEILRHTPKGYVATRKQGGWIKSNVFGKSFRLTRRTDHLGDPEYTLEVR